jgi:hypothetical protein
MIFISYASEDAAVADTIRAGLEQAGVACWIAPRDIEPGTSFPAAITAAIQSCRAQVLLLTAQANVSRHVLSEVELAFNAGKPILAVLVGKVAPSQDLKYFISTSHWFDADASFDDDDLAPDRRGCRGRPRGGGRRCLLRVRTRAGARDGKRDGAEDGAAVRDGSTRRRAAARRFDCCRAGALVAVTTYQGQCRRRPGLCMDSARQLRDGLFERRR